MTFVVVSLLNITCEKLKQLSRRKCCHSILCLDEHFRSRRVIYAIM